MLIGCLFRWGNLTLRSFYFLTKSVMNSARAIVYTMLKILKRELLSNYSTFKIGGVADYLVTCNSISEIIEAIDYCDQNRMKFKVIGKGSNVLFSDLGFRGMIIINNSNNFSVEEKSDVIILNADGGVILDSISRYTSQLGYQGLEWAVGIPGTISGAILTNAGTSAGNIANCLNWIKIYHKDKGLQQVYNESLEFDYRTSIYKKNPKLLDLIVILSSQFLLKRGNQKELVEIIERRIKRRQSREPMEPNVGSIFKNPPNNSVRKMSEDCGLIGSQFGDAAISDIAPSFIVNKGNARALDVLKLIVLMKQRIFENYNIRIFLEIDFIGEVDEEVIDILNIIQSI